MEVSMFYLLENITFKDTNFGNRTDILYQIGPIADPVKKINANERLREVMDEKIHSFPFDNIANGIINPPIIDNPNLKTYRFIENNSHNIDTVTWTILEKVIFDSNKLNEFDLRKVRNQ